MNAMNLEPYQKRVEQLSDEEKRVLIHKGTERPFSGKYTNEKSNGIYTCKISYSTISKTSCSNSCSNYKCTYCTRV